MSLIKFNNRFPWSNSALSNFITADDFFNDDFFAKDSLMPAMNVKENEENFEIELAAPGFSKDDFEVTLDNNGLHISAEKSNKEEEKEEGYIRKEFSYNSFTRNLKLPENVNLDEDIKANYTEGILKLGLMKKEQVKVPPKKIIEVE